MTIDLSKYPNLNKHFENFKHLGNGGFGVVYSAVFKKTGKRYAIKILVCNDQTKFPTIYHRFKNEVEVMKKIKGPNVVEIFGSFVSPKESYIAMEYLEGQDLKKLLQRKNKLEVDEAINIAKEICRGLIDIHEADVVHRDLKPSNVLFDKNNTVKLIDFGISVGEDTTRVTQTNKLVGSVQYVAPELVAKSHQPSPQSDIYSLGIMLYEMLSGHLPFTGGDHNTIALQHINKELPPLEGVNVTIPQSVENIILKCTAKKVENRYASALDLYEDLNTCLNQNRASEDKISVDKPKKKSFKEWLNSKPVAISLIVIFIVLLSVAITLTILWVKGKL